MSFGQQELTLITGGVRSGKSRHALQLAQSYTLRAFLATAVATDEEIRRRIQQHQTERGTGWDLLEEPREVANTIRESGAKYDIIVLDCLTFWISNLLLWQDDADFLQRQIADLGQALAERQCHIVVVTNEVGWGVVPENKLARHFRDLTGLANQMVAEIAGRVILMTAGIPMEIKTVDGKDS